MSNLADLIENFILGKLAGGGREVTVLRRNELAEELQCAPSQISYVLSTRFTVTRGFHVESRRGSGGYIRILRIPIQEIVYEDAARQVREDTPAEDVERVLERLRVSGMLSPREADLLQHFYHVASECMDARDRALVLRALLRKLADFS